MELEGISVCPHCGQEPSIVHYVFTGECSHCGQQINLKEENHLEETNHESRDREIRLIVESER